MNYEQAKGLIRAQMQTQTPIEEAFDAITRDRMLRQKYNEAATILVEQCKSCVSCPCGKIDKALDESGVLTSSFDTRELTIQVLESFHNCKEYKLEETK